MREVSLADGERNGDHGDTGGLARPAMADHGPAPYVVALDPGGGGDGGSGQVRYNSVIDTPSGVKTLGANTPDLGRALKTQGLVRRWVGDQRKIRFVGEER